MKYGDIEVPLFENKKESIKFYLLLFFVISLRLSIYYYDYLEFASKPFVYEEAVVSTSVPKNGFKLLKLDTLNGLQLYGRYFGDMKLNGYRVWVKIYIPKNLNFFKYMRVFFTNIEIVSYEKSSSIQDILSQAVAKEHTNLHISSLYQAIYLAIPPNKYIRDRVSLLGISHLVALSGFHIGMLWAVVFFVLKAVYTPLQQRYYPFRYDLLDIGIVTLILLGVFTYVVGSPPSLMRSYIMMLIGWSLLLMGIKLVSFELLFIVMMLLITFEPRMFFSISFWFSVAGVFYIFVVFRYFVGVSNIKIAIVLPFSTYIFMMPIVHMIFGTLSAFQLLSPVLSIVFIIFYPLSLFLHFIGYGYIFDDILIKLLDMPTSSSEIYTDKLFFIWYMIISILSIWYKVAFVLLILSSIVFCLWIYI